MDHPVIRRIQALWAPIARALDVARPLVDAVVRLVLARVFFLSGLTKIQDWGTTVALFSDEYQVPFLPPELAAFVGTAGELALPVLLVLGLGTRFAACGLFVLNIVAVVSYWHVLSTAESPAALHDHLHWGLLLAWVAVSATSPWTLDRLLFLRRRG